MTQITSGRVVFSRTVKTGDFENMKAEVELCFNVDDGQNGDMLASEVGVMAVAKAHEMLGKKAPVVLTNTPRAGETAEQTAARSAPRGEKEKAAENLNATDGKPLKRPPGRPKATQATDELEDDHPKTSQTATEAGKVAAAADDFDAPSDVKEITDVDLTSAASRKNAELAKTHGGAAPAMIRGLRDKFFAEPQGKQLKDIPQDKRGEFMKQLEALK